MAKKLILSLVILLMLFGWSHVSQVDLKQFAERKISYFKRIVSNGTQPAAFETDRYYSNFLPYFSKDLQRLPIELPNATFDPTEYESLSASGFHNEYIGPSGRLYMVQYKTPKDTGFFMDTRPLRRFNQNVYVILATQEELKSLTENSDVNFIDHYHPHYKLHPEVVKKWSDDRILATDKLALTFSSFITDSEIKLFLNEGSDSQIKPIEIGEDGQTYVVSGLTNRNELFRYAMDSKISEIKLL